MGVIGGPDLNTDSLVAYLNPITTRCYTTGATTATDLINNTTVNVSNGIVHTSSSLATSWNFDGTDEKLLYNANYFNDVFPTSTFTIDLWFNLNEATGYRYIFSNGYPVQIAVHGGYLKAWCAVANSGGYFINSFATVTSINTGTWYNATFVNSATNARAWYINGVSDATNTSNGTIASSNTGDGLNIGQYGSGGYPFNGQISQVKLYNRVLSAAEVKENYDLMKSLFE